MYRVSQWLDSMTLNRGPVFGATLGFHEVTLRVEGLPPVSYTHLTLPTTTRV